MHATSRRTRPTRRNSVGIRRSDHPPCGSRPIRHVRWRCHGAHAVVSRLASLVSCGPIALYWNCYVSSVPIATLSTSSATTRACPAGNTSSHRDNRMAVGLHVPTRSSYAHWNSGLTAQPEVIPEAPDLVHRPCRMVTNPMSPFQPLDNVAARKFKNAIENGIRMPRRRDHMIAGHPSLARKPVFHCARCMIVLVAGCVSCNSSRSAIDLRACKTCKSSRRSVALLKDRNTPSRAYHFRSSWIRKSLKSNPS